MNALTITGTTIHQDAEGRYCLNDLHRAAGGEKRHQPSDWLRQQQTQELIAEMSIPGIPGVKQNQPLAKRAGAPETGGGTFVCKELVYAYAMWISPAFHLKVIRAYDAMVTQPAFPIPQTLPDALRLAADLAEGKALAEARASIAEQREQEQRPKAEVAERIAVSEGGLCITDAAKALQVRPRELFRWLQAHRWIYRRGAHWVAYQPRIASGHLEHKVTTLEREDGPPKVVEQVLVTPRGLARLAALLNRERGQAA